VLVPIDDIYYFNADHKYVTVRYTGGEVLIEEALKALEIEFGDRFYRIHRNALINLSRVNGLKAENDGHYVSFQGIDNTLEVSRRHLSGVRKTIKNM
jgi:two-component system response regulator AlgR